jgi:transposase InsO family protein
MLDEHDEVDRVEVALAVETAGEIGFRVGGAVGPLSVGVAISRSRPGCPWENGYQESFYSSFKVELGDPNRFASLGEFVYAIYQAIHTYNRSRIHTALKMPPAIFAQLAFATPA